MKINFTLFGATITLDIKDDQVNIAIEAPPQATNATEQARIPVVLDREEVGYDWRNDDDSDEMMIVNQIRMYRGYIPLTPALELSCTSLVGQGYLRAEKKGIHTIYKATEKLDQFTMSLGD